MVSNKRLYIYLILLVIAVITMVVLKDSMKQIGVSNNQRDFKEIMEHGEMNVVTDYNSIGYFVSGDTIEGFQHEMIQALEREWGITINLYLQNSLDDNLYGLQSGKYDLVARNIPINSELIDNYSFTQPLNFNKLILVQRKVEFNDSIQPIRQHLDLAKKTIYVEKDSPSILRLNNLSNEIGDTIFLIENSVYEAEQLVMMVASGDIDFTVCDEDVAVRLAQKLPEIDIETDISFTQIESWAVRRESTQLLDSLNTWLTRFKETVEFEDIISKYYK